MSGVHAYVACICMCKCMCIYVFVCVACVCCFRAVCVLVCAIRAVFVLVRVASAQICCLLNLCCLQMTKKLLLVFVLYVCVCVCVCRCGTRRCSTATTCRSSSRWVTRPTPRAPLRAPCSALRLSKSSRSRTKKIARAPTAISKPGMRGYFGKRRWAVRREPVARLVAKSPV